MNRVAPTRPPASVAASRFQTVAEIEIEAVTPSARGFVLSGRGSDRLDYRLDVHFELPLDARTRKVIGELLTQSDVTVARRNS